MELGLHIHSVTSVTDKNRSKSLKNWYNPKLTLQQFKNNCLPLTCNGCQPNIFSTTSVDTDSNCKLYKTCSLRTAGLHVSLTLDEQLQRKVCHVHVI